MTPASLLQAAVAGVLGAAATPAGVAGDLWAAAPPAAVTFHLMQIEQVIGGVNGDATVQAIQLRMRSSFQQFVAGASLRAWDAQGLNPVLLTGFGSNVPIGGAGRRVLITTANFSGFLDGPLAPNFIMANPIPASYLAAGSITFESDTGTIWWRLSWGGAGYTGSTLGAGGVGGNDTDGDFGRWPGPFPASGVQALRFQGPATAQSLNNANDYALTAEAATFTNNAGQSATLASSAPCPWDCQLIGDGIVNPPDLMALISTWGGPGPCDFDGSGAVNVPDLLKLLANWGVCQ